MNQERNEGLSVEWNYQCERRELDGKVWWMWNHPQFRDKRWTGGRGSSDTHDASDFLLLTSVSCSFVPSKAWACSLALTLFGSFASQDAKIRFCAWTPSVRFPRSATTPSPPFVRSPPTFMRRIHILRTTKLPSCGCDNCIAELTYNDRKEAHHSMGCRG